MSSLGASAVTRSTARRGLQARPRSANSNGMPLAPRSAFQRIRCSRSLTCVSFSCTTRRRCASRQVRHSPASRSGHARGSHTARLSGRPSAWVAAAVAAGVLRFAIAADAPALDVPTPYLPSTQVAVDEMLRLADVRPDDVVVDLGSGDGRIVIAAAKLFGARGFGVDIDEKLVAQANENARAAGVAERVCFHHRDIFATDIREASVVTLYLLSSLVNRLRPKLLAELKPGTRIVAHDYGIGGWKPDRTVTIS